MFKKDQRGFTLIELLVVIVIIGILSSFAILNFSNKTNVAKLTKVKTDLETIHTAMEIYYIENDKYPDSIDELVVKGYLKRMPSPPIKDGKYEINSEKYVVLKDNEDNIYTFPEPENFECSSKNL